MIVLNEETFFFLIFKNLVGGCFSASLLKHLAGEYVSIFSISLNKSTMQFIVDNP
jgi:hypothetical protein